VQEGNGIVGAELARVHVAAHRQEHHLRRLGRVIAVLLLHAELELELLELARLAGLVGVVEEHRAGRGRQQLGVGQVALQQAVEVGGLAGLLGHAGRRCLVVRRIRCNPGCCCGRDGLLLLEEHLGELGLFERG